MTYGRTQTPESDIAHKSAAFRNRFGITSETFEEFFNGTDKSSAEYLEDDYDDDESQFENFYVESAFPDYLESDPGWVAIYEAGLDYIGVAREAFPELVEANDAEVDEFLFAVTENMSPEELEGFWNTLKNIGSAAARVGRQALRVAAPVIQAAAPTVGTAVGAAFGGVGAPIGGAIGSLLGSGVGALNARVNAPSPRRRAPQRRPRPRRRLRPPPAARRRLRRRVPRRSQWARAGHIAGRMGGAVVRSAGSQLVGLMQNPQIQNALVNAASRGVGAVFSPRGESMSETAAIAALAGGLYETLREIQESGVDLDSFDGDFAPGDFETAEQAFETLVDMLEEAP